MSCWKKINTAPASSSTDLMSIMDEEIAHKMQSEEESKYNKMFKTGRVKETAPKKEEKVIEEEELTDEELARRLQAEEDGLVEGSKKTGEEKAPGVEEEELTDEELARRLQAEEDDLAYALRLQAEWERADPDFAEALALDNAWQRHYTPSKAISSAEAGEAADEDYGDEEYYEEDYADLDGNEGDEDSVVYTASGARPVVLSAAQAARVPAYATKHDAIVNGRKNAEDAAAFVDANFGGDGLLPNRAYNALREHSKRAAATRVRVKEAKSDPARRDMVLDTEARLTLQSLLNTGVIADLSGTLSSGKEANVYHAYSGEPEQARCALAGASGGRRMAASISPEYALKVFKTVKEFHNRAVYLGEEALGGAGSGQHSHRVIRQWAQKELRNLIRLRRVGVPCPLPLGLFGSAVLAMEFLGREGRPAPMLRDVGALRAGKWGRIYAETVRIMRSMYQRARLVHADLSEYNLLYHEGRVWVIDVAQSVPYDHRNATVFLRRDCQTITTFFRKKAAGGLVAGVLTLRELFEYVTDPAIPQDEEGARLNALLQRAAARGPALSEEVKSEEAVFMDAYIPPSLNEVVSSEALDELADPGDDPVASSHLALHGLHKDDLGKGNGNNNNNDDDDNDDDDGGDYNVMPEKYHDDDGDGDDAY